MKTHYKDSKTHRLLQQVKRISKCKRNGTIPLKFVFKVMILILSIVYLGYIWFQSLEIIYLIIASYIISIAVESIVWWCEKKLPRWLSIWLAYFLLINFLVLWVIILVPFVAQQSTSIIKIAWDKLSTIRENIRDKQPTEIVQGFPIPWYAKTMLTTYVEDPNIWENWKVMIEENIKNLVQAIWTYITKASWLALNALWFIFTFITQLLLIFILAIFFSFEKKEVINTISMLSWNPPRAINKLTKLYTKLWAWLKWQLLLCLFIGISVYAWLRIIALFGINIPDKFTLALIAWLTEFIPYAWPILWAIPALMVGVINFGLMWFLSVAVLFILIQQLENNFLIPIIMKHALWISPLLIFLAMLIGATVMWFIWIILAIPLAVIISILFEDLLKSKKNKDSL